MTKQKSTKRALLLSALSLLMCVSMLIGSTFAWFTDSVTSAGNTIQSGTLDVDLVDAAGNSMEGEVIEFVTTDGRAQNEILWEPGCTYETEPVYVVNKGNLALKYQIVINGIDGNAKLLEAIEWTINDQPIADMTGTLLPAAKSDAIVLSGHMKEEAGNEYQGLTVKVISIAVFATQLTYESDSFNDQYDAEAEYAATTMLKKVAAVAAGESATVKLEKDGYVVLSQDALIGAVVKGDVTLDLNGKTLFVKAEDVDGHQSLFNIVYGGKLTVTGNGSIKMVSGKNESKVTAIFNNTSGTLVIENGSYAMDVKTYAQGSMIPTIIDNNGNAKGATTIINGGTFYHTRNMFRNFPSNNGVTELVINGGTFNGEADDWAAIWNQKASSSTKEGQSLVTVNGGIFNYVEISNDFETGVTIADGVVVPVLVDSANSLKAALANGGNIVLAADVDVASDSVFATIPAGVSVKLDMAGHKINVALGNQDTGVNAATAFIKVENGGSLVIDGDGEIFMTPNKTLNASSTIIWNQGNLTINSGDFEVMSGTSYAGGYIIPSIIENNAANTRDCSPTLTINGGTFTFDRNLIRNFPERLGGMSTITINGGTFTSTDDKAAIWNQWGTQTGAIAPEFLDKHQITVNGGTFNNVVIDDDFKGVDGANQVIVADGVNITVE